MFLNDDRGRGFGAFFCGAKCAFLACLWFLAAEAPASTAMKPEEYLEYSGAASDRHKADLLYHERHILTYRDARLVERNVLYSCADGTPFARKRVRYVDDQVPDFTLDDASNGMREGVDGDGAARIMFFKPSRTAAEKRAQLPTVPGLVADAGFDNFIPAHWNALMHGEPLPLPFLVISRLQVMNFEVQHVRTEQFDGRVSEVFRMRPSSLLRLMFGGIEVTYDGADRRLVRYEGLTDVRDASGDNFQANIEFHANDRKPSSAQALTAMQAAVLAPCH